MKLLTVLAAALLLAASPALAEDPAELPGAHIVHDYVLTMDKVKAYAAAYDALHAAAARDAALQADYDAALHDADPQIADTIAKMDHHPRVYAFFKKEGLSPMEAALMPIIVRGGCIALEKPDMLVRFGAVIAQSHVEFCKAHHDELQNLNFVKNGAQSF